MELLLLTGGGERGFVDQQPVNHLFHVPAVARLLRSDVGRGRCRRRACSGLRFVYLVDGPSDLGVLAQLPLDGRVRLPPQCHPDLDADPPLRLAAHYPPDSVRVPKPVYVLGFPRLLSPGTVVSAVPARFAVPFFVVAFASFVRLAA